MELKGLMKIYKLMYRVFNKLGIDTYFFRFLFKKNDIPFSEEEIKKKISYYHSDKGSSSLRTNKVKINIQYDIQIIVPVYNVENYLQDCLNSILNQEFVGSYIITIVNDGSTDRSSEILSNYESNPYCEIINKENGGLSSARNKALEEIKGEYLFFVDSDDIVPLGALNALYTEASKTKNEIIFGPYERIGQFNEIISSPYFPRKDKISGCICGKLYHHSLFRNIIFPDNYWFEDTIVAMIYGPSIKKFSYINDIVYFYRYNENGISESAKVNNKMLDTLYVTLQLLNDLVISGEKLDIAYYNTFLEQVVRNQVRINFLNNEEINKLVFYMHCYQMNKFKSVKTDDKKLKLLEWALINKNYSAYMIAI